MKRYVKIEVIKELVTDLYFELDDEVEEHQEILAELDNEENSGYMRMKAAMRKLDKFIEPAADELYSTDWEEGGVTATLLNEVPAEEATQYSMSPMD